MSSKKIWPGECVTTRQAKEKFEMNIIIGKTTVRYNQNKQLWQAINGRILSTHPPGQFGKLNAIIDATTHEAPNLAHLCRSAALKRPDLTEAIWNAARYVINRAVIIPQLTNFGGHLATIQEDDHHFASISMYHGCLECDRSDCAHTIAYLLQVQLWGRECGK